MATQQEKLTSFEAHVFVVVDGSNDGTAEMLDVDFQDVQYILGDGNWWYTKSMNEAFLQVVKADKSELVICLNDDIILADDFLQ